MGKLRDLDRRFFTQPSGNEARRLKLIGRLGATAILIVGVVTLIAAKATVGQMALAIPLGIVVGGAIALLGRAVSR